MVTSSSTETSCSPSTSGQRPRRSAVADGRVTAGDRSEVAGLGWRQHPGHRSKPAPDLLRHTAIRYWRRSLSDRFVDIRPVTMRDADDVTTASTKMNQDSLCLVVTVGR